MVVVAGGVCSHIGTVSQAVPAAMSQVARRHMRTRRKKLIARVKVKRQLSINITVPRQVYRFGVTALSKSVSR